MASPLLLDPEQRFACRDCPARCCRLPARVVVSPEEHDRLVALPWVRERLHAHHTSFPTVLGNLCLPVVESNRLPQCVFLDPDELCSIHKREGVEATPLACRIFPFGLVQEPGGLRTYLSHLCPSIRDNYGELLAPQLEQKRSLIPQPVKIAQQSPLGTQRLDSSMLLAWADRAVSIIQSSPEIATGLHQCAEWTTQLAASSTEAHTLSPDWLDLPVPPPPHLQAENPQQWPGSAKILLALLLLPLAHPIRLHLLHCGLRRVALHAGAARFIHRMTRLHGTVDLMFTSGPACLASAARLPSPASDRLLAQRMRDYIAGLLKRRNVLLEAQPLEQSIFRLILAAALVSWFARIRAASRNGCSPDDLDVREGISACEFVLTYHGCVLDRHPDGRALPQFLSLYPPARDRLLRII